MEAIENNNIDKEILAEIARSLKNMNYGEVVITIHDSNVVQIERREKKRFKTHRPLDKQG